jgi:hypothetical protein
MLVVVIHYIITKKLLNYRCRTARLRGNRAVQKKKVLQGVQGYGVVQEYGFYGSTGNPTYATNVTD